MTDKTPEELQAEQLAEQARLEDEAKAKREADLASVPRDEPLTAAQRLRAFEDEAFGPDAVRINGQIERGSGSMFKAMPPARHRQYAALERLVEAEHRVTVAADYLTAMQAAHATALADVETAADAAKPEGEA